MVSCGCDGNGFSSKARNRVVMQHLQEAPDDFGGRTESWQDGLTVWAMIEPMAGREIFVSSQLQSRVDARVTVRYQAALADTTQTAKLRLKHGARLYNVKAVRNLAADMKTEGTAFQQLMCTEGEPS